jgi:hypothetical protein
MDPFLEENPVFHELQNPLLGTDQAVLDLAACFREA